MEKSSVLSLSGARGKRVNAMPHIVYSCVCRALPRIARIDNEENRCDNKKRRRECVNDFI